MKRALLFVVLLASGLMCRAEGNRDAGEQKAAACKACHGASGVASVPLYPNLAGQNAAYLSQALQAYKKGERQGGQAEVMKAFVAGLSQEDIENLAAFYASQRP